MPERKPEKPYTGFEQGPIRPPSEAHSLLIRVTRNCPWNRCTFCPVYKDERFSVRPTEHVLRDIEAVHRHVRALRGDGEQAPPARENAQQLLATLPAEERGAFQAAFHWVFAGHMRSVFLQDANSLILRTAELLRILEDLYARFPAIKRVTSYARAHTIAAKKAEELQAIRDAGLNRLHIGLESGSDRVLERVRKGVTQAGHVEAGQKAKAAGFEVSEYVMPGLGGVALSEEHARESARALNQINPDFIRLRSLAIPGNTPLRQTWQSGEFEKCTDRQMATEILLFLESLDGITSMVRSDHILNLFGDLEGRLPEDKDKMIAIARGFLELGAEEQMLYQVGRRTGQFHALRDLSENPEKRAMAERTCREWGVTPDNVDTLIDEIMTRFI